MPNSRHMSVIASPSSRRATKRRRSSITELSFHGIHTSRPKAKSVTHVSGTKCHPCLRPHINNLSDIIRCGGAPPPATDEAMGGSAVPLFGKIWDRIAPMSKAIRADAERSAQLDDHIAAQIRDGEPGLAIAIVKSGTVAHAAGYGLADLSANVAIASDTIFHLASCGKQF